MTQAAISREDSYRIVQGSAMKVWENLGKTTFRAEIEANGEVTSKLSQEDLDKIFDYQVYTKNIDGIFNRVFA